MGNKASVRTTIALMNISLREARIEDRAELQGFLADYLFEFDGRTGPYPELDSYWTDSERIPFFVTVDGNPVGVCLIRTRDGGWSIAEFWVKPSHRRGGVGRAAVEAFVERARDADAQHLEAKIHPDNGSAFLFWSAIGFEEISNEGVLVTRRQL